jgi:hypothetical protein
MVSRVSFFLIYSWQLSLHHKHDSFVFPYKGGWIVVLEIIPGFSLYRGLYEFGQYAFSGTAMGTSGMKWANLSDSMNGMRTVLIIMVVEWAILLPLAFYLEQVSSLGGGLWKRLLTFLKCFKKRAVSFRRHSFGRRVSKVILEMENPGATQEVS